jgi:hypothetical protein
MLSFFEPYLGEPVHSSQQQAFYPLNFQSKQSHPTFIFAFYQGMVVPMGASKPGSEPSKHLAVAFPLGLFFYVAWG